MTQPGLERILNQERELEDEWNDLTVRAATFRIDRTIRPRGVARLGQISPAYSGNPGYVRVPFARPHRCLLNTFPPLNVVKQLVPLKGRGRGPGGSVDRGTVLF